jgi:hypothetical protein
MRNGEQHPKNYPWWPALLELIAKETSLPLVQVGIEGETQLLPDFRRNLPFNELEALVRQCTTWISVDSFFQHLAWYNGKRGIVLFGQSDPNIFGHPENINLLRDRRYLRPNQFLMWEQATFSSDAFVVPGVVTTALRELLEDHSL